MARSWTDSQQKAITLKGKTLLVSAAAGSGKTSVLTQRIIQSLLDPHDPADLSRMLVVTFTRAAAAELKSRISQALSDALARDPSNERLSKQLFLLGGAQISTIDSFFQKVVRANFDTLELPASFRIASNGEIAPIATQIMDGLIADFYDAGDPVTSITVFDRILSNPFATAMDHLMSGRSDGKLTSLLLDFLEDIKSYPKGIELLLEEQEAIRRAADKDFLLSSYGRVLTTDLEESNRSYLQALHTARDYLQVDPDAMKTYAPLVADDTDHCNGILSSLDSYEDTKALFDSLILKSFPGKSNKPPQIIALQRRREKWREMIKKYKELFVYSTQEIKHQMERTADLCLMLYRLFHIFEERLMQEKRTLGMLEFNDIRTLLYRMLTTDSGAPTDFAKSLSQQYDAVYIDEYQDVDFVQDGIFAILGENKRFMVGDIKQSIYGFRGGEPSIFAGYRQRFPLWDSPDAHNALGNCIFMSENFRCDAPVVDFTNMVCSFLFSACEDSIHYRREDDLICSKGIPDPIYDGHPIPARVEVFEKKPNKKAGEADDEEDQSPEEIHWVGSEIMRLLRNEHLDDGTPIAPDHIALLVRTKAQGKKFQKELERLHIPVAMTSSSDILESPLLIDVMNLLRSLDNPYSDLSLSEFLISPIGGFNLEELAKIREAAPDSKALYDALEAFCHHDNPDLLYPKAQEMLDWMEHMRQASNAQPADRFLRILYLEDRLTDYAQCPECLFIYEQARTYQRTSWCGLYGFLQHFDKLKESGVSAAGFSREESAISIMTVHHSKGLEFPVVFLCGAGAGFNKKDLNKNPVYHKTAGFCSKLYSPQTGNTDDTLLRMAVKMQVKKEQNEENIRTLYVALTRARERLIVTGTASAKWDSFLSNAQNIQRGNTADILNCNSYLAWITAAWENDNTASKDSFAKFTFHPLGSVIMNEAPSIASPTLPTVDTSPDPVAMHYAEILQRKKDFSYPLSFLNGLPTMAAASKLRHDLLDVLEAPEGDEAILSQIELMTSAAHTFDGMLKDHNTPTAADIGTATHDFLQFCNFKRLTETDVESEAKRLVEAGFLRPEAAEIINKTQLTKFCGSDLMKMILSAKTVLREQKFNMYVPLSELTHNEARKEQLREHPIFVQGFIDLLLITEDDCLILVDYKTDHIRDEEKKNPLLLRQSMQKKHATQLTYYTKAVEQLFGRKPDQCFIYSLSLGKTIDMDLS